MGEVAKLGKCSKDQLSLQVLKRFRVIFGSVRQHFRAVEQNCGVTGAQLWIMQEVAKKPGIGVTELAGKLSIHQSTCSLLVEKLASRKLVVKERSKEDQRRVGLRLPQKAVDILKEAPGPAEGILPEALQALPEPVLQMLNRSLNEVIGQLRSRDDRLADKPLSDL